MSTWVCECANLMVRISKASGTHTRLQRGFVMQHYDGDVRDGCGGLTSASGAVHVYRPIRSEFPLTCIARKLKSRPPWGIRPHTHTHAPIHSC
ncbi:hypothetical protein EGR_02498 [Echinococcus granulosus]|uniref:Uncharacterized protein n=1 Tax=Echinococcus granulosus TaxID=6210 RepID=W6UW79_ECHGR|nr:hypothetical protein EGR_02498 [Echinococcus granulosus]EUB62702.1 hypothetical protein EGR_02498 [Echinococcus granulosus]